MAVAYAKERVQFGRTIATFQAVKHHCANMLVDVNPDQGAETLHGGAALPGGVQGLFGDHCGQDGCGGELRRSAGMSFRIVSQSGSKLLCDKVLKRAIDSEQEASRDKRLTELTPANYKFQMEGSETIDGRPAYILKVEPLLDGKFLYRGRIWVDAADFEVVKMEAEPARNPSFFISRTLIHYTGALAHGFWLPRKIRSETKVRIGGTAVLTIDYGNYHVESNAPLVAGN